MKINIKSRHLEATGGRWRLILEASQVQRDYSSIWTIMYKKCTKKVIMYKMYRI